MNSEITHAEIYLISDTGKIQSEKIDLKATGKSSVEKNTLYQNYPNPFSEKTTIRFDLTESGNVTLSIYDFMGSEIGKLEIIGQKGRNEVEIDSREFNFEKGILIYKIESKDFIDSKKMTWIK